MVAVSSSAQSAVQVVCLAQCYSAGRVSLYLATAAGSVLESAVAELLQSAACPDPTAGWA